MVKNIALIFFDVFLLFKEFYVMWINTLNFPGKWENGSY